MGLLQKIIGAAGTPAIDAIGSVVGKAFENKQAKLTHEEIMATLAQNPQLWQADINKIEAQHRSLFVAGWRPAIGWICGFGLANTFLINPWLQWMMPSRVPPVLPEGIMLELVLALLGLGALRSMEKMQGRAK